MGLSTCLEEFLCCFEHQRFKYSHSKTNIIWLQVRGWEWGHYGSEKDHFCEETIKLVSAMMFATQEGKYSCDIIRASKGILPSVSPSSEDESGKLIWLYPLHSKCHWGDRSSNSKVCLYSYHLLWKTKSSLLFEFDIITCNLQIHSQNFLRCESI